MAATNEWKWYILMNPQLDRDDQQSKAKLTLESFLSSNSCNSLTETSPCSLKRARRTFRVGQDGLDPESRGISLMISWRYVFSAWANAMFPEMKNLRTSSLIVDCVVLLASSPSERFVKRSSGPWRHFALAQYCWICRVTARGDPFWRGWMNVCPQCLQSAYGLPSTRFTPSR